MKITRIACYQVKLPLNEGAYRWSFNRFIDHYDSTLVSIDTDAGVTGWGEACQLGPAYLPAYAEGTRTGIRVVAPDLIGLDPCQSERVYWAMDMALKGHPYVKTAIDNACWDIAGQVAGLPVSTLLGGRFDEELPLYRSISQDTPDAMVAELRRYRARGFRSFQLKVGGVPDDDIERIHAICDALEPGEKVSADANTGWLPGAALRVVKAVHNRDVYIEQPCLTYEECLTVRRHTDLPMILDECMDSTHALLRGHADGAMDGINIKIGRLGGLTRARQVRDLGVVLGIAMTIEDSGGGDVAGATISHLSASTPTKYRFMTTSNYFKTDVRTADGAPRLDQGRIRVSAAPGLGVTVRTAVVGKPLFEVR
jgi:L-alanine-DL-glutamate epimerase-like enolase superfamily enzyme